MACTDCQAARETMGLWRMYNPACLWCGARLIQKIGRLSIPQSEATARRKVVLADWIKQGHSEQELRDLAKGPMAFEPVSTSPSPALPSVKDAPSPGSPSPASPRSAPRARRSSTRAK
jgi:hypothetical protein